MLKFKSVILFCTAILFGQNAKAQDSTFYLNLPKSPGWSVVQEGQEMRFLLETMPVDISVQYSIAQGKQEGMAIDSSGQFVWRPSFNLVDRLEEHKAFPVIFEVTDDQGRKDSQQVDFIVLHKNQSPEIKELKPFYIKYGVNNIYKIDQNAVTDPDDDPWVFKDIPAQMPEGLTLSENGQLEWRPSLTQYRRLRNEPLQLAFLVEDQPSKAQEKGLLTIRATFLDLPPAISSLPDLKKIKIRENETVNIKFFLSDPNGDENISEFNFLTEDHRIPSSSLIRNTATQYEFVWTPDYDFVFDEDDSISFGLTFYVIDKSNLRENKALEITVYDTENLIEKERLQYAAYSGALTTATELLMQLNKKERELKRDIKKARGGKRNRTILNASLGAATGLSPVFLESQPQKYVSGIGGTTVMTLGTLEATEIIGKSSKALTERLNYVLEKKNSIQNKGNIFARKYAFNSSRNHSDFEKDLEEFLDIMNLKNLASLELDAGWENKNKKPGDQEIKKIFPDFNEAND